MAMPATDGADEPLITLVQDWVTVPDLAKRTGVEVSRVRRMISDGEVLALRVAGVLQIPELFLVDGVALSELKGTLTVLADSGFRPAEAVGWLFTRDDTLVGGRPIDALRAGRKTEVRRRAQAMAL